MKVKTSDLTRAALNWVVASIEWPNDTAVVNPDTVDSYMVMGMYDIANDAFTLTSLIERERITAITMPDGSWSTSTPIHSFHHDTWLHAVLRCHITNKLGDEVEVPDHLL